MVSEQTASSYLMACTGLHTLSLRQNLLSDASDLQNFAGKAGTEPSRLLCPWHMPGMLGCIRMCLAAAVLQELVLHDNHLTQVHLYTTNIVYYHTACSCRKCSVEPRLRRSPTWPALRPYKHWSCHTTAYN